MKLYPTFQESAEAADTKPLRITGAPDNVEQAKQLVIDILNQSDDRDGGFGGRGRGDVPNSEVETASSLVEDLGIISGAVIDVIPEVQKLLAKNRELQSKLHQEYKINQGKYVLGVVNSI